MLIDNFEVIIEFKNKDLETVNKRKYILQDYLNSTSSELKRTLADIENLVDDWTEEKEAAFKKIRSKILNVSNSLVRLPQNLYYKGKSCSETSIAELFDR